MKLNCVHEEFKSIQQLIETLDSRPNNKIMAGKKDSDSKDRSFTGSKNYAEAKQLLVEGYNDVLEDVKDGVRKNNRIIEHKLVNTRKIQNMPVGFIPNVPNALQNKPDSMINIIRTPQKRKTMTIVYAMSGNAGVDKQVFIKAGTALVSAINLIELSGVQTKLYVDFMAAECNNEILCPVLCVKDFGERFNLTKICFPLVHPSMFRRIGFKYLETCPNLTESGFNWGYGRAPSIENLRDSNPYGKNAYMLNTRVIENENYSIEKILNMLEIDIKSKR